MLLDRLMKLPPRTSRNVRHRDVAFPICDGAILLGDVYLPPGRPANLPC